MKDFTFILAAVTVLCGIAWFWDFLRVRPLRNARILAAEKAAGGSISKEEREKLEAGNWFVDLGRECFWVLLAVFLFRAFLLEPVRIPSESMMPTLLKGDFVAVSKYAYGIRNPFTGHVMIDTGSPSRGDIAVFRYPEDPDTAFIKRIIGLPGDTISYDESKNLVIKPAGGADPVTVPKEWTGMGEFSLAGHPLKRGTEDLLGVRHDILEAPDRAFPLFAYKKQEGMPEGTWQVPEGMYFAMGDNRDNSRDSRFWGFVPAEDLIGPARFIWLSVNTDCSGMRCITEGLRFGRLGSVH